MGRGSSCTDRSLLRARLLQATAVRACQQSFRPRQPRLDTDLEPSGNGTTRRGPAGSLASMTTGLQRCISSIQPASATNVRIRAAWSAQRRTTQGREQPLEDVTLNVHPQPEAVRQMSACNSTAVAVLCSRSPSSRSWSWSWSGSRYQVARLRTGGNDHSRGRSSCPRRSGCRSPSQASANICSVEGLTDALDPERSAASRSR